MTLIASIYPREGRPLFVCDTLVSEPGRLEQRLLSPNGVILRDSVQCAYRPWGLRQKSVIINNKTLAAYAGSVVLGSGVIRRLQAALAENAPSLDLIEEVVSELDDELQEHNTSVLIAFIDEGALEQMTFGHAFSHQAIGEIAECYAAGSGVATFFSTFPALLNGALRGAVGLPPEYVIAGQVCGLSAEFGSREAILGEFDSHFGGIIEIICPTDAGFVKLPSATIITEVVTIEGDTLTIKGGNYLQYCYSNDILVYRRFGNLRGEQALEAFGTDYLAATIAPPNRRPTEQEVAASYEKIVAMPHEDSVFHVFSWSDLNDLARRRLSVRQPDNANFRIWREDDHFNVFRSKSFLDELAKRFGATKIRVA